MHQSRRSFLASAAGLGAAGLAGAALAGRRAPSGPLPQDATKAPPSAAHAARPVVGSGSARFEVWHDWLVPPSDGAFGDTHGVAQDAAGNIYVAHTVHPSSKRRDAVYVYSKDGTFLRSFGSEFAGGA
ncbi:MAG: hypothetical protein ACKPBA_14540, partial [Planctomycetota bacterium]